MVTKFIAKKGKFSNLKNHIGCLSEKVLVKDINPKNIIDGIIIDYGAMVVNKEFEDPKVQEMVNLIIDKIIFVADAKKQRYEESFRKMIRNEEYDFEYFPEKEELKQLKEKYGDTEEFKIVARYLKDNEALKAFVYPDEHYGHEVKEMLRSESDGTWSQRRRLGTRLEVLA
jgi:hypothetical protein